MIRFDTFGDAGWGPHVRGQKARSQEALNVGSAAENVFHLAQQRAQQGLVVDLGGGLQFL
jgi:hypothetical protein